MTDSVILQGEIEEHGAERADDGGTFTLHTDPLGDLSVPPGVVPGSAAELEALAARAALYATRARGDGTRRVYRSAWHAYTAWCHALGRQPLAGDPELVAIYAPRRADQGVAVSTLRVDLAAIRTAHLLAGVALDLRAPGLAMVVEGITRGRGTRPTKQAAPAVPAVLRLMLGACAPATAALRVGDVEPVPGRGVRLLVRRSKTNQHGKGQDVAVWANPAEPELCPAAALDAWLAHRERARDLDWAAPEGARGSGKNLGQTACVLRAGWIG